MNNDFRVGPWLVQPSLNTISQNGTSTRLEPKVMEVLVCLSCRAGEPISKEELLQTVWPDTFVSDDVLKRSISELRRVFGDDARESRIIETIPKRGYRLVAPVEPVNGSPLVLPSPEHVESRRTGIHTDRRTLWMAVSAVAAGLLCAGLLIAFNVSGLRDRILSKRTAPPIHSLAVLPLQNLSGDPAQEYFADGMTEELITVLSHISALKVISRTSVMRYKKTDKSLSEIAHELGVDAIVEGSVLRAGERVRITVQLIYAPKDTSLWAQTYADDLRDVLTLQSNIASAIADEIKAQLTPSERAIVHASRRVNLAAHEAYLQGRFHLTRALGDWYKKNEEKLTQAEAKKALNYFQQAIKEDPDYAPAYIGMSDAYSFLQPPDPPRKWMPLAKVAVVKALGLDDSLAEGHSALAGIRGYDRDWLGAEKELKRAIELDSNNAPSHHAYGVYLGNMGRPDESMREFQRAQDLDPQGERLADAFYYNRQFDRALELYNIRAQADPTDFLLHLRNGFIYGLMGRHGDAVNEYQNVMKILEYDDMSRALGRGFAKGGYQGALQEWTKGLEALSKRTYIPGWSMAQVYAQLGDKDRAFAWMERAYIERDGLDDLKGDPAWDPLRSDPRFADLIQRMGL